MLQAKGDGWIRTRISTLMKRLPDHSAHVAYPPTCGGNGLTFFYPHAPDIDVGSIF